MPKNTVEDEFGLPEEDLTEQQRLFAMNYLIDPAKDVTKAARDAGYKDPSTQGKRVLAMPKVKAFIENRMRELQMSSAITPERIIARLGEIAFADPGELAEWRGGKLSLTDSRTLPPATRRLLSSVAGASKNSGAKIKLHDSLRALELLASIYGMTRVADRDDAPHDVEGFEVVPHDDGRMEEAERKAREAAERALGAE